MKEEQFFGGYSITLLHQEVDGAVEINCVSDSVFLIYLYVHLLCGELMNYLRSRTSFFKICFGLLSLLIDIIGRQNKARSKISTLQSNWNSPNLDHTFVIVMGGLDLDYFVRFKTWTGEDPILI